MAVGVTAVMEVNVSSIIASVFEKGVYVFHPILL
jgi:hypothetical protein